MAKQEMRPGAHKPSILDKLQTRKAQKVIIITAFLFVPVVLLLLFTYVPLYTLTFTLYMFTAVKLLNVYSLPSPKRI